MSASHIDREEFASHPLTNLVFARFAKDDRKQVSFPSFLSLLSPFISTAVSVEDKLMGMCDDCTPSGTGPHVHV
jgi:hypothetical protein